MLTRWGFPPMVEEEQSLAQDWRLDLPWLLDDCIDLFLHACRKPRREIELQGIVGAGAMHAERVDSAAQCCIIIHVHVLLWERGSTSHQVEVAASKGDCVDSGIQLA